MSTVTPVSATRGEEAQAYTWRQKLQLFLISSIGTLAVRLIGMTLRVSVHIEEGGPAKFDSRPLILCFWHRAIFSSTWVFRRQQIGVITSQSFDGEYIARIISTFGYTPIRGSSSRGGVRALLESRRILEQQRTVAFTTDGPRGPVYVAKPGPVLLASKTGVPIVVFHVAAEKAWLLGTWDRFVIPKPFSRVLLYMSRQMPIPAGLATAQLEQFHAELQAAQERVRDSAEAKLSGGVRGQTESAPHH